jgi:hypothetical protein
MERREGSADHAAPGVPDEVGLFNAEPVENVGDAAGAFAEVEQPGQRLTLAVTRRVHQHDRVAGGETGGLRLPEKAVHEEAGPEDHRGPLSRDPYAQPAQPRRDVTILEHRASPSRESLRRVALRCTMDVVTGSDGTALSGDLPWSTAEVAGSARLEALRAQRTHPALLWFGPTYGVMERTGTGWLMSPMTDPTPQTARDGLGWWFRILARRRSTGEPVREEYWEASALLERERLNELTVAGRCFRVVRADRFFRYGLTGPEQPRSTDPDTDRTAGRGTFDTLTAGLLGPAETPGTAALLGERWEAVPTGEVVPAEVTADARKALITHPKIVMLAPRYAVTEQKDGHWPAQTGAIPSPHDARRALAMYFNEMVPVLLQPPDEELAAYRQAAQRLERERLHQIRVAGRRFRIMRVETAVRVGPDGPESPRPSDHDPEPPLAGETEELRTWDLLDEDD